MKKFLLLIFGLCIVACNEYKPSPPIKREVFVSLLIEMHLIESEVSFNVAIDQNMMNKSYVKYNELFKKFKTDSISVAQNFDFYQDKNDELLQIFHEVKDSLIKRAEKSN